MRFSLRTLIVVMLLGGLALAGMWTVGVWAVAHYHQRPPLLVQGPCGHCSDEPAGDVLADLEQTIVKD
jgi:hypothetical protein